MNRSNRSKCKNTSQGHRGRNGRNGYGELLLMGLVHIACSANFFMAPRTISPGMSLPTVTGTLLHKWTSKKKKKNDRQVKSEVGAFAQVGSCLPKWLQLVSWWHDDIKLAITSSRPNISREKLFQEGCSWPCKIGKRGRFFSKEHVNVNLMNMALVKVSRHYWDLLWPRYYEECLHISILFDFNNCRCIHTN